VTTYMMVVGFGLGNDVEGEVRVLEAAEFGALTAKHARLIGLHPDRRRVARNEIALSLKVRRLEAVNHVPRRELSDDRPADRNVQLVRRQHMPRRNAFFIFDFPPPLVAAHRNRDRA
jgi:hypothetical protein